MAGAAILVVAAVLLARGGGSDGEATLEQVGQWQDVADLTTLRGTTSAVLLRDDRVLAVGGGVGSIALDAAETFDPVTSSWSSVAALSQPRRGAAAALLDDGRVLVAGGIADNRPLASAEIYDPATDRWTPATAMGVSRLSFTLTSLPDGRVLAVGGTSSQGREGSGGGQTIRPSATAEVFDPAAGTWEPVASMADARFEHTATPLPDGRVLVAGGLGGTAVDGEFAPLASVELYDPAIDAFTIGPSMQQGRTNHVAVAVPGGGVVVAGGLGQEDLAQRSLATAERYDPAAGGWRSLPAMRQPRAGAVAVVVGDGGVLVIGGEAVQGGSRRSLATAELLQRDAASWASAGRMACARSEHAAVVMDDGRVLVVAGDGAFPGEPPTPQGCADLWIGPAG